ncbi:hypothetical protein FBY21_3251 [Pseudomonas sp. SLBN-26]|uniref:MFS transporter n=1 Tax=Metapseudomonas otitidis TaxID=319939 RepID=A0ABU3XQW8_9GAMM|nr:MULTISPECIES: hypothetical protein [Pseudomonas]KIV73960.1 Permeases of the major facilitator superfamily [Pseudomonas sp. FeS53a]MBO2928914.1 MFS transporter [Pseudomonas otitidis]MCO7556634.1 MFS transporter [Pseudomonas otitidis]MCP1618637.1 hypothetical protein [Pseudomonas otitidis]MDV3440342.1 MFS transporter [Pseudomonas otitidis]
MTRSQVRRLLALEWWAHLGAALGPLFLVNLLFGSGDPVFPALEMPLFVAALISMFISLPLFRGYKRALIATEKALDGDHEREAWIELRRVRRVALLGAGLPAWVGAVAVFAGLNAVALVLLALSSAVVLSLYRIPRQLA